MQLLLVEDDLQLGAALSRSLMQYEFECVWVRRLKEAREQLVKSEPEAVILDINLPDGEGFDLLNAVRATKNNVPIVVMTARDSLDDRLRGLNGGADDYIAKPFAVDELIARVRAVLRRSAGFATQKWMIGDLEIDPQTHQVKSADKPVSLTPLEYKILFELARHTGRVVARGSFADRIWGYEEAPSHSALEFQIHSLRKKIGGERIVTVRGVGYMLKN